MPNGVKMIMITYNEAIDIDVMETLENCSLKNYTKIMATYGKGATSGTHLGNDIWPGRNNILYIACHENEAQKLIAGVRELRKKLGKEGIKAFMFSLEDVT